VHQLVIKDFNNNYPFVLTIHYVCVVPNRFTLTVMNLPWNVDLRVRISREGKRK